MAWISFGALSCRKRNLMTARVSMLLKSRASLTCFPACFRPGRAKDLSAPRYNNCGSFFFWNESNQRVNLVTHFHLPPSIIMIETLTPRLLYFSEWLLIKHGSKICYNKQNVDVWGQSAEQNSYTYTWIGRKTELRNRKFDRWFPLPEMIRLIRSRKLRLVGLEACFSRLDWVKTVSQEIWN